jgi:hypothetical protein
MSLIVVHVSKRNFEEEEEKPNYLEVCQLISAVVLGVCCVECMILKGGSRKRVGESYFPCFWGFPTTFITGSVISASSKFLSHVVSIWEVRDQIQQ